MKCRKLVPPFISTETQRKPNCQTYPERKDQQKKEEMNKEEIIYVVEIINIEDKGVVEGMLNVVIILEFVDNFH